MTRQEAIQALVNSGWPLLTAKQAVANLDPVVSSPSAGTEALDQINQAELERLLEEGAPIDGGKPAEGPAPLPGDPDEPNLLLISGQRKLNDPRPAVQESVTPEEQAAIDDASPQEYSDVTQVLAEQAGLLDEFNYDWVHALVTVGSLDSNEALIAFYEKYIVIDKPAEVLTDKDEIVIEAKSILSRGRENPSVEIALKAWGQATGNYEPLKETDGVNNLDILEMMQIYEIDEERATTIGRVANSMDLEPMALAQIWHSLAKEDPLVAPIDSTFSSPQGFHFVVGGLLQIGRSYKEGLELYDESHLMAAVHLRSPELAQSLLSDPYALDAGELRTILSFVGGGAGSNDPQINWIKERLAGGFKATELVDKEAMRNAVQVLADGWNLTGTEGVVAGLTAELVAQAVARAQASLPNPFGPLSQGTQIIDTIQDQAAAVKRRLRATPEYQELFGHLAGGESEEEFVRRFENRSQQVFGDDIAGAVRNAMRTGNVNTIFQQGLNTPIGESSTRFQEIMARNAQTFRDLL